MLASYPLTTCSQYLPMFNDESSQHPQHYHPAKLPPCLTNIIDTASLNFTQIASQNTSFHDLPNQGAETKTKYNPSCDSLTENMMRTGGGIMNPHRRRKMQTPDSTKSHVACQRVWLGGIYIITTASSNADMPIGENRIPFYRHSPSSSSSSCLISRSVEPLLCL